MFGTAHATRSRMNSLGQNQNQGSFYFDDNRNDFRNPANVGKIRNFMVAELEALEVSQSNLEGGFFGEFNSDLAFGVYLGKESVILDTIAKAAAAGSLSIGSFPTSEDANPLNLFLGGGSDFKWGLNVNYANSNAEMGTYDNTYSNIGAGLGIETKGGLQAYLNYIISNESKLGSPNASYSKLKNTGMQLGLIYPINSDYTIWGQYGGTVVKASPNATNTEIKLEGQDIIVGLGRIFELSPTSRFNFDLSFNMAEGEDTAAKGKKISKMTLPLVIGFEGSATDWLTLRGSIEQGFILNNYKIENKGSTTTTEPKKVSGTKIALGAGLQFGKLKIDGNLGGVGSNTKNSLISSDFFVNAAATFMY